MKILVVDDEMAVCNMLVKFLTGKGHKVTAATAGEEAIAKTQEDPPDVVLLDIVMPGVDGFDVLNAIRAQDKKIVIIMITAIRDTESAKKCLDMGANDYITKPFSLSYLDNILTAKLCKLNQS